MTYLLDVNTLVALGCINHEFHSRVASWLLRQDFPDLATCAITELGFVRVVSQVPDYGVTVTQARSLLLRIKESDRSMFIFIVDDQDISALPGWVKSTKQITDGHLVKLANTKDAALATLDRSIPGAYVIPEE